MIISKEEKKKLLKEVRAILKKARRATKERMKGLESNKVGDKTYNEY